MPVHFSEEEMRARRERASSALAERGLDALLMFKQESMYYLSGYDTFGFSMFQCLVMDAGGRTALLTRMPDLRQARYTSDLEDIRIWHETEGANPVDDLRALLREFGLEKGRVGIELDSYGLKALAWERLKRGLDGFCVLEDASTLVDRIRSVKSPREIEYARRAAELADDAWDEAVRLGRPGAFEGDILAAMQGAVFKGGGDYAGNEFIIGSGPAALLGPLPQRPAAPRAAGPAHARVRRRLPALPRRHDAHPPHPAAPIPATSTCTARVWRRCTRAWTPCGRA